MSPAARRPSTARTVGLLVGGLVAVLLWWTQGDAGAPSDADRPDRPSAQASSPTHDYTATTTPSTEPGVEPSTDPDSGLPVVRLDALPPEAADALERIERGGPFPFPDDDGGVFENREERLPDRPEGHYREYTVGGREGDRGPLRIVAGADGERYWTDDHYRSFSRIEVG